ncbi:MAG: aminotransferase class V-fold PLP-dependent enzyme [Pirellula sp.]|jgi:dTDP-4-amino-4,6-dideoxygalactose transaminase|nr:aminotransferase class V-fold PLP-dependent enzyme [Pirellula sp.]
MSNRHEQESITSRAIAASVLETLRDGHWRAYNGPKSEQLTGWLQSATGLQHIRLCSSGTIAVELALRALHLKSTDEVILSGYDFPGNFRAVEDAGGKIVLCDPAPECGWVLTPERLEQSYAPEFRAVVVSHLHGQLAPMASILDWANSRNVVVIEDACQAQGAMVDGKQAGAWGHLSTYSFGGSKLVSAGRGGAVLTNDSLYAQRMRVYCERGNDAFAMSEIQSALVLPQCERLADDHAMRLQSASQLYSALAKYRWLQCVPLPQQDSPAFYKFGILVAAEQMDSDRRDSMVTRLAKLGIEAGAGFMGFANRSSKRYRANHSLEVSKRLASNTLLIHHSHLLDPATGANSIDQVANAFEQLETELSL